MKIEVEALTQVVKICGDDIGMEFHWENVPR